MLKATGPPLHLPSTNLDSGPQLKSVRNCAPCIPTGFYRRCSNGKLFDFVIRVDDGASALAHICDLGKRKPPDHPGDCYLPITNVPLAAKRVVRTIRLASGQRESATNRRDRTV